MEITNCIVSREINPKYLQINPQEKLSNSIKSLDSLKSNVHITFNLDNDSLDYATINPTLNLMEDDEILTRHSTRVSSQMAAMHI
ncbi:hypothetical protein GOBAR_DD04026 [Gossypium barbadense]|nr:hypothetical protein GOBAR_DD04026 [Gossypium barbadense]